MSLGLPSSPCTVRGAAGSSSSASGPRRQDGSDRRSATATGRRIDPAVDRCRAAWWQIEIGMDCRSAARWPIAEGVEWRPATGWSIDDGVENRLATGSDRGRRGRNRGHPSSAVTTSGGRRVRSRCCYSPEAGTERRQNENSRMPITTYRAVLTGDHLEWRGETLPETAARCPVAVDVTIMRDERFSASRSADAGTRMAAALEKLATSGAGTGIKDPVAWQREVRRDRPLPGRD